MKREEEKRGGGEEGRRRRGEEEKRGGGEDGRREMEGILEAGKGRQRETCQRLGSRGKTETMED